MANAAAAGQVVYSVAGGPKNSENYQNRNSKVYRKIDELSPDLINGKPKYSPNPDKYFEDLGYDLSAVTRIPGNRK